MRVRVQELETTARSLRKNILQMICKAKNGHPGGSLSAIDIILELFENEMRHDKNNPKWPERDRFVLSKGHGVPALYAVLAHCGYLKFAQLMTLRELGSPLQGHPANRLLDCIEASTGSLGQGLSVALGMAMAARIEDQKSPKFNVYALLGDGEMQEGQVWEAFMCAAHHKVGNLTAFIDKNLAQIDGYVEDVMNIDPLDKKLAAFGWHVLTIDGHNFYEIHQACQAARNEKARPTAVIAHTIKGKGVSFIEDDRVGFHGKALTSDELERALNELSE